MNPIRNEKRRIRLRPSSTIHYSLFTIHSPKAFTLVELLTMIVIISMLAAISLVALSSAYTEAKIAKTRGTIAKLDAAIQQIFEEYEDRFETMSLSSTQVTAVFGASATDEQKALLKLHFIRDTMRMEMPQNWAEVFDSASASSTKDKLGPLPFTGTGSTAAAAEPAVLSYYYDLYKKFVNKGGNAEKGPNPAALLYLIIANLNPEALENFHGSEIAADPDDDNLLMFVDAWGRPIQFLRWAPGFMGSDRQPDVLTKTGLTDWKDVRNTEWNGGPNAVSSTTLAAAVPPSLRHEFNRACSNEGDPFDTEQYQNGWFLYPLIYSPGPDGIYNIYSDKDANAPTSPTGTVITIGGSTVTMLDPFVDPWGIPDPNGTSGGHLDNIHNHRYAGGF